MSLGIYIGRFQPFHNGHLKTLRKAISENSSVLMLVGSVDAPRTRRNPFFFVERKKMIIDSLDVRELAKVIIAPLEDRRSDNEWVYDVNQYARKYSSSLYPYSFNLYGDCNDHTSYYLKLFPYANECFAFNDIGLHSEQIREKYFEKDHRWKDTKTWPTPDITELKKVVPNGVYDFLEYFMDIQYSTWKSIADLRN